MLQELASAPCRLGGHIQSLVGSRQTHAARPGRRGFLHNGGIEVQSAMRMLRVGRLDRYWPGGVVRRGGEGSLARLLVQIS